MNETVTIEMSKSEAEQLSALIETCISAMQESQRQMADDQEEIERLKISTRSKIAAIRRALHVETNA